MIIMNRYTQPSFFAAAVFNIYLSCNTIIAQENFHHPRGNNSGIASGAQSISARALDVPFLNGVDFADSLHGWFVGNEGTVIHTGDGGKSWSIFNIGRNDVYLLAVDFINENQGWVAGSFQAGKGIILRTNDGGKFWQEQHVENSGDFYAIEFLDEKHGWAGGQSTGIWYTTDGGVIWNRGEPALQNGFILSICFLDSLNGWADGFGSGVIGLPLLHTTDGGKNWKADSTMLGGQKVFFTDSLRGWIMRAGGGIWRTVDGGKNWRYHSEPQASGQFLDIYFPDSLVGYISSEAGTFSSTDGGRNWQLVSGERAKMMYFINRHFGWGARVTGRYIGSKNLAYTSDSAKTWNAIAVTSVHDIPTFKPNQPDFTLNGSYPNPFNAQAKICFQLHRPHIPLNLRIYDIHGRELRALLDEPLPAGIHHVIWDGKNAEGKPVAAGIYFYQISAGQSKETEKMLLLP